MVCYKNSIEALHQLLHIGTPDGDISYKITSCQVTKASKDVTYAKNGTEYYFVEVTCSDGTQYGLQAYGEEANELYKEVYRCVMCGSIPREKGSTIIEQSISGKNYVFDSDRCALIFRRLRSVMGEETVSLLA
jgi:hypothetical protein